MLHISCPKCGLFTYCRMSGNVPLRVAPLVVVGARLNPANVHHHRPDKQRACKLVHGNESTYSSFHVGFAEMV